MYEVDCFDSSTVQLVSQFKLPTKQLHDLKWPAFRLTALSLLTAAFTVLHRQPLTIWHKLQIFWCEQAGKHPGEGSIKCLSLDLLGN